MPPWLDITNYMEHINTENSSCQEKIFYGLLSANSEPKRKIYIEEILDESYQGSNFFDQAAREQQVLSNPIREYVEQFRRLHTEHQKVRALRKQKTTVVCQFLICYTFGSTNEGRLMEESR